jgi:hypothetical protein
MAFVWKMGYTVCERLVKSVSDMAEVERVIVKQTGGENHRCAFFRTVPYIRLRIAALYIAHPTPHVAYFNDLSVTLRPTPEGALVTVSCAYEPTYPDDFEASSLAEVPLPCQKRLRAE